MKNIFKTIVLGAAAISLASCDDFLTKSPTTSLSPENFFSSEKELELWTNREYTNLLGDADDFVDIKGDDFIGRSLDALQKGTRTNSTTGLWTQSHWGYLRHINQFFENAGRCTNLEALSKYEGVEYFFRAYFYYQMVQYHGDVPYYDKVVSSSDQEQLMKARDSRGYVMKKVMDDLDKAIEKLPDAWPEGVFRVNKYAAYALKSRAALFEGTFRKYHNIANETVDGVTVSPEWFLRQSIDAAQAIMASGKFSMYAGNEMGLKQPYREFFQLESLSGNSEAIFAKCYDVTLLIRHGVQFNFKNETYSATRRQVNHYLLKDGKPIQTRQGWEIEQYYEQFQNRDPRLSQTLHAPGYFGYLDAEMKGCVEVLPFNRTMNGYRIIKFVGDGSHENATTSTSDFAFFRYGEVLLNYAEAKAELGELTQEDIDKSIKFLRSRVNMPNMTLPTDVDPLMKQYYPNAKGNQLPAILEVRRERVVELFAEGIHRWDLLRWGEGDWITPAGAQNSGATLDPACSTPGYKGIYIPALGEYDTDHDGKMDLLIYSGSMPSKVSSTIPSTNRIQVGANSLTLSEGDHGYITRDAAESYKWEAKDYLYPIPLPQIQAYTNGALTQNPGWE